MRIAATLVVLVIGLAACASATDLVDADPNEERSAEPGEDDRPAVRSSGRPSIGDCFATTDLLLVKTYDPTRPTSCEQPHTLETFAVLDVPARPTRRNLPRYGRDCNEEATEFLGGTFYPTTIAVFYFGPPPKESDEDAWVRCDVGVMQDTGAQFAVERTGSLRGVLRGRTPVSYRACLGTRPRRMQSQDFVDCGRPHVAEHVTQVRTLGGAGARYPGRSRLLAEHTPWCRRASRPVDEAARGYLTVPTALGWRRFGSREALCWAVAARGQGLPGMTR
ncbi:MAG: hypothetical protein GEU93_00240 [Propionibacteriales bacterium]|nr:hypothetical protein [Propionibacteriales bacterium]